MTLFADRAAGGVVVVGGGIAGVTAAYRLASRGVPVRLLDKSTVGSHQSGRNWGFVRRQGCDPVEVPLVQRSSQVWRRLGEEIGADLTLVRAGLVNVADTDQEMAAYRDWLAASNGAEVFGTRLVGPDEVRDLVPALAGAWAGGLYTPTDGHADPGPATAAICRAAQRLGAVVEEGVTVRAIRMAAGRVTGVDTSAGPRHADAVICAAGAWAGKLLRPLGIRLPIRWIRATAARTTPAPAVTQLAVSTPGVGFSQTADGSVIFGSAAWSDYDIALDTLGDLRLFLPNFVRNHRRIRLHLNRVAMQDIGRRLPGSLRRGEPFQWPRMDDPPPNRKKIRMAHRTLTELVPALSGTRIARWWGGTVDVTPDALPVVGRVDGIEGLVLATGLSSHGFGIGPGAGAAAADVAVGAEPPVDLEPFRVERFAEGPVRAHHHL